METKFADNWDIGCNGIIIVHMSYWKLNVSGYLYLVSSWGCTYWYDSHIEWYFSSPAWKVGVLNGNKGILHEYGLDDFIQIQHNVDYHGHYDDIKYTPPGNWPKFILISWENFKDACMSLLPN